MHSCGHDIKLVKNEESVGCRKLGVVVFAAGQIQVAPIVL